MQVGSVRATAKEGRARAAGLAVEQEGVAARNDEHAVLARDVARAPAPVLDLYREEGSLWSHSAAEARRIESKRGSKLDYRPYALADTEEIPGQLQGWLHHLGWL